jgi:hypothetical protein
MIDGRIAGGRPQIVSLGPLAVPVTRYHPQQACGVGLAGAVAALYVCGYVCAGVSKSCASGSIIEWWDW